MAPAGDPPLLAVEGLAVRFATSAGVVEAVREVSFTVAPGETVGIVGESGSGKSVTALAAMNILPANAQLAAGRIRFAGREPGRTHRGMAMIFQNPRAALNPIRPVGRQIVDALRVHAGLAGRTARDRAVALLDQVRIRQPDSRFWAYPFELSGGMCQRAMIAVALASEPRLLIADEPTTGLDVTTQKAIVDLLAELSAVRGMATLLITHDLALAGERCDRLIVMQGGRIVETGPTAAILRRPQHAYTEALIAATRATAAAVAPPPAADDSPPLLEVEELTRIYRLRGGRGPAQELRALDAVSLSLDRGESVGLIGESGSGKSTLAGLIVRLADPTSGRIRFRGQDIGAIPARDFAARPQRRDIQMVFQDPNGSLNPRQRAFDAIAEPLRRLGDRAGRAELADRIAALAITVGLPPELLRRLPHQLSGGEKARVGIARAIALRPSLLVLDEPTAALDVRTQALVLDLLAELRRSLGMAYLFVSHDLTVVRRICSRALVMQAGRIVDRGPTERLLSDPSHPYTRSLVAAIPAPRESDPLR